jgi:aspartyl-tRNA(Asn)/glutamyl-tRNA(Gln) amidotransferase subunit C
VPVEIDIDHVARLARLRLSAEEKERLRIQLGLILEHAERVQEVAAEDVPPTSYAVPRSNVFRPDEPVSCLGHEEAMAGAPEREDDRFKVPRVVELEDDGERP